MLDGEPLEVDRVGGSRRTAVAQHVGHVLEELGRPSGARIADASGPAIELLAAAVALLGGNLAVGEAAREQLDLGAGGRERTAEGVVVRRRVGRGIDDVYEHSDGQ